MMQDIKPEVLKRMNANRRRAIARLELRHALEASHWNKFKYLWKTTPKDCKQALLLEFLFKPQEFKVRYDQEVYFKYQLIGRFGRI